MAKTSEKPLIFIVEDDELWAENVSDNFQKKFRSKIFASGEEALEALAEEHPKIVVLDYHLEGEMTGMDTLKKFSKQAPDSYVVMFSAQDDVQVAVNILNEGAYDYVVKNDSALNRLRIITRNILTREDLHSQVVELRIRFRRERMFFAGLVVLLLAVTMIIYLQTCPQDRVMKWDPFQVEQQGACRKAS